MRQNSSLGNIDLQYKRTVSFTALIALLSLPGFIINPWDPVILGFVLGSIVGVINANFLVRRMRGLTQLALEKEGLDQAKAKMYMRVGFYPRMGMIIAVVFLASKISFISLYGMGAGLLLPTLVTVVDANVALYRYFAARNAADKI